MTIATECSLCKATDCGRDEHGRVYHNQTAVQHQRKLVSSALKLAIEHRDACESALAHTGATNDRIEYDMAQATVQRLFQRREALYQAQA